MYVFVKIARLYDNLTADLYQNYSNEIMSSNANRASDFAAKSILLDKANSNFSARLKPTSYYDRRSNITRIYTHQCNICKSSGDHKAATFISEPSSSNQTKVTKHEDIVFQHKHVETRNQNLPIIANPLKENVDEIYTFSIPISKHKKPFKRFVNESETKLLHKKTYTINEFLNSLRSKKVLDGLGKKKNKKTKDKKTKDKKKEVKVKEHFEHQGKIKKKQESSLWMHKNKIHKQHRDEFYNTKIRGQSVMSNLRFNPYRIYIFGEKGSGFNAKGPVQDFYTERDRCVQNGELFEDSQFPCNDSSLYYSQRPNRRYEWLRPSEIVSNPQLFVEGYSRFDVQQGELGDCWLLAAVANLTLYRRLFFQVVPDDQNFEDNYAGIFHFRFWQYGRWIDVVIDDRLPTYNGKLIFLHSTEDNEFWSALLEKAYAKLHGSYEALKGGSTCEAMEDFTGGVTEMYEMNATPPNLFKIILKAFERASLMGCSIEPDPNVTEAETPEGLIRGHAYSITRVKFVDIETPNTKGKIPLLRLRNPWGNEAEWNGPWCDKSPEWNYIPEHEKEDLGLNFDDDGEFWMSFKDFAKYFDRMEICNLNPDSLSDEDLQAGRKRWEVSFYEGEWVRGVTAGGCRNFLESFWHNPQYRITLTEVDDDDEEDNEEGKCTLIVALMQKNRRSQRNMGIDVLTIGFAIYHLPQPDSVPKPLDLNFFKYNASVARSPSFINLREVSCRFKLPPGTYCIVPSTFDPNEEGEFLVRVFSEHQNHMEENDTPVGYGPIDKRAKEIPDSPNKKVKHVDVEDDAIKTKENEKADQVYEFFLKLAGEDKEVDWKELKDILDYSMKDVLQQGITRQDVRGVEATPNGTGAGTGQDPNVLTTIIGLLCGTICKDTPLADLMPAPTESTALLQSRAEPATLSKGFSKDICRGMVAMLDSNRSGKLGYEEFKSLWVDIRMWKSVFKLYDKDLTGYLDAFELREALNSAGYTLNNHILNMLMHRYGNRGTIEFDDFISCAVKLKTMMDVFKEKDENNEKSASFTLDEWIEKTVYC